MTTAKKTDMRIFNSESRIKCDLELTLCDWWLRSICSGHVIFTAAAVYFNVNYYNVYHTRGVSFACIIWWTSDTMNTIVMEDITLLRKRNRQMLISCCDDDVRLDYWWLRSQTQNDYGRVARIDCNGFIYNHRAWTVFGLSLACMIWNCLLLWICADCI